LFLDCASGVSGSALLGALLDAGAPAGAVRAALAGLGAGPIRLRARKVERSGLDARAVAVDGRARRPSQRTWPAIRRLLSRAKLADDVRAKSLAAFERIARAQARVRGAPLDRVGLDDAGALGALAEVVGVCAALAALGVGRVTSSPVALGATPGPLTLEVLRGVPTRPGGAAVETVTPIGAALVAALADAFGPLPALRPTAQGFGADDAGVLRAVLGEADPAIARDEVAVLETHLDDMTPEHLAFLVERLHEDGALDASLAPLVMKKGRPGQLLRVLARPSDGERLARAVLAASSALGVRIQHVPRLVLRRDAGSVRTKYGAIRVKVAHAPDGVRRVKPEYDACARAARAHGVSIATVTRAAERRAEEELA
jgi:pyridinium-3,5-bisthiocarboxylic acid mononucleotide nickel chelatase